MTYCGEGLCKKIAGAFRMFKTDNLAFMKLYVFYKYFANAKFQRKYYLQTQKNMLFCEYLKMQNLNCENTKYCVIATWGFVTFCHAHLEAVTFSRHVP